MGQLVGIIKLSNLEYHILIDKHSGHISSKLHTFISAFGVWWDGDHKHSLIILSNIGWSERPTVD